MRDASQYLLRIIELLDLESRQTASFDDIEQAAEKWAKHQSKHPQKKRLYSETAKERFTCHAFHWLQMINRLTKLPEESSAFITNIFQRGAALKRHSDMPLLKERLLYLQEWKESGGNESGFKGIFQYLLVIMKYLNFNELRTVSKKEIEKAATRWAKDKSIGRRHENCFRSAKARFIHHALAWLKRIGCLQEMNKETRPFEGFLNQYIFYMRVEQGFSESTIEARGYILHDFLEKLHKIINNLIEITPLHIDNILKIKYVNDKRSRRTIQNHASVIRSFLKYAEEKCWCKKDLSRCLKAPRVYTHEELPYSPSWEDVKKLISSCDTHHLTDIRDRAILLLLSVYGLRRSEVAHLCLEDFDWKNELLHLWRAKNSKPQTFPLSKTVGNAILDYIQKVRQNICQIREVFLCRRAPY